MSIAQMLINTPHVDINQPRLDDQEAQRDPNTEVGMLLKVPSPVTLDLGLVLSLAHGSLPEV